MEGGWGAHSHQKSEHEFHSFVAETESGSEYDDEDSSEDEGMQTLSEEEEQSQAGSGFAYPENKPRRWGTTDVKAELPSADHS